MFREYDQYFISATATTPPPLFIEDLGIYQWAFIFAVLFTVGRFFLVQFVLKPVANAYMTEDMKNASKDMLNRFCESAFRAMYYAPSWLSAFYLWQREPWAWDKELVWANYPFHEMSDGLRLLNMVQLGWYFHCTYAHVFLDSRKQDFVQMLIHHITAICLINFSVSCRYPRLGLLVYVSLDICDVFLEMAKVFRYLGYELASVASFFFLVVTWLFFRLGMFPYLVVYSGTFYCPTINPDPAFYWTLVPPAWVLLLLQIYWFILILRIAWRVVVLKHKPDDDREPVLSRESGQVIGKEQAMRKYGRKQD